MLLHLKMLPLKDACMWAFGRENWLALIDVGCECNERGHRIFIQFGQICIAVAAELLQRVQIAVPEILLCQDRKKFQC